MYLYPHQLRKGDKLFLDTDNTAHTVSAVYRLGPGRWGADVPDAKMVVQMDSGHRVKIIREVWVEEAVTE